MLSIRVFGRRVKAKQSAQMIVKLERTQSNAQQNKPPTTNGKRIKQQINNNNRTTALERTAA